MNNITAFYTINRGEAIPFDLNEDTLDGAISETIEFWNEAEGSHGDFEVSYTEALEGINRTWVEGTVTHWDDELAPTEDTILIGIDVEVEED